MNITELPDCKLTATGSPRQAQPLTGPNLKYVLDCLGITLRYDVMSRQVVFVAEGVSLGDLEQERVRGVVRDSLQRLDVGGLGVLDDMLGVEARRTCFHPMEEWVLSDTWDGQDRMDALAATVPVAGAMFPVYLRKWLIQAVEAIRGWRKSSPRSLPHVLVFVGGQGMNKGRWIRALAPQFTKTDAELHLNGAAAKDHQIEVLRAPIVELGELDSTFRKSDVSALKAFLSRSVDTLREPYARAALSHPRTTVFIGTVNDMEFLGDPSGSRRFWPVEVTGELVWDHGLDMQQIWAQANEIWEQKEDWNLSAEEDANRIRAAQDFTSLSPEVEELTAYYEQHRHRVDRYVVANKTEIMRYCGCRVSIASMSGVTAWLHENLGKPRKIQGRKRVWMWPLAPEIIVAKSALKADVEAAKNYLAEVPATKTEGP